MNIKNFILPGRRDKLRSELSLRSAKEEYINSCRNLSFAKFAFWVSFIFCLIKILLYLYNFFY